MQSVKRVSGFTFSFVWSDARPEAASTTKASPPKPKASRPPSESEQQTVCDSSVCTAYSHAVIPEFKPCPSLGVPLAPHLQIREQS